MGDNFFVKGDIIHFNFKDNYLPDQHPQYTIKGPHFAVVLFDARSAKNTITIAPITSLYDDNGQKKSLYPWDMELDPPDPYNLEKPSYIKMDQIHTVDRNGIDLCDKIPLDPQKEIPKLELCLISVFELFSAIDSITKTKLKSVSEAILEQFDEKILEKVKEKVQSEVMPHICSSFTDRVNLLDIDNEIKEEVVKALKKEQINDNSNLSNKIVRVIKDVIRTLFEK